MLVKALDLAECFVSSTKGCAVKKFSFALVLTLIVTGVGYSQGKGVDKQSERVRDGGSSRTPASNGGKQDTGAGRGFDFGKGKSHAVGKLANPYRLTGRRDVIIKSVQDVMRDRKLIVDYGASDFPRELSSANRSGSLRERSSRSQS